MTTIVVDDINSYPQGSLVYITTGTEGFFDTVAQALVDPGVVTLKVCYDDGPVTTYTYGSGTFITKVATGRYSAQIDTALFEPTALCTYQWSGSGGAQALDWNVFQVIPAPLGVSPLA